MGAWMRDLCRMSRIDANRLLRERRFLITNELIGDSRRRGALSDQPGPSSEPGESELFTGRGFTVDGQLLPDWATEA